MRQDIVQVSVRLMTLPDDNAAPRLNQVRRSISALVPANR
jgi:hypothetical protein